MNYQYTYFVHPFVIGEGKYQKYILNLIKDDRFKLRVFEKSKDIDFYYFKQFLAEDSLKNAKNELTKQEETLNSKKRISFLT